MVRFTVLASGSKGNSTVVSGGRTRILVDCGLSCRELFRRMKLAGEEPETLDAIVITHEHHGSHQRPLRHRAQAGDSGVLYRGHAPRLDALADAAPSDDLRAMAGAVQKQAAERQAEADAARSEGERMRRAAGGGRG